MRHGCPVSQLVCILQAEAFRNNKIKFGFPLPNPDNDEIVDAKLSAYVRQLFSSTENSIEESFKIFDNFDKTRDAYIHKTNTTTIHILDHGKLRHPSLKKSHGQVKLLGVYHEYHIPEQEVWINYKTKTNKKPASRCGEVEI